MATSILPDQARQYRTTLADRPEPPRCPYSNRSRENPHPDGVDSRTCPICRIRNAWVAAQRRVRIAAGRHTINHPANRGRILKPERRNPVPKCGLPHRPDAARRACERCKARKCYVAALLRDARNAGRDLDVLVDPAHVVEHVTKVLVPSGLTIKEIAKRAGVSAFAIQDAIHGRTKMMMTLTAEAVLAVRPLDYRKTNRSGHINGTGVRRMLRGLLAQGWTVKYLSQLEGIHESTIRAWIDDSRQRFVAPAHVQAVKRLVEKLGEFDLGEIDDPMDGMSRRVAARAARLGWNVLADWDGLDIDDPRVTPHGYSEEPAGSNGLILIDADTVSRALEFEPVKGHDGILRAHRFTTPVTRMEFYEIIRVGSEPDHTGQPRFSANVLSQRLGGCERTIQRCRAELARADRLLDEALPAATFGAALILAMAELPAELRLRAAADVLLRHPLRRGVFRDLVVLGATQPTPYGRGWSDEQLADWLGCAGDSAASLRTRAAQNARDYYEHAGNPAGGRPRKVSR